MIELQPSMFGVNRGFIRDGNIDVISFNITKSQNGCKGCKTTFVNPIYFGVRPDIMFFKILLQLCNLLKIDRLIYKIIHLRLTKKVADPLQPFSLNIATFHL